MSLPPVRREEWASYETDRRKKEAATLDKVGEWRSQVAELDARTAAPEPEPPPPTFDVAAAHAEARALETPEPAPEPTPAPVAPSTPSPAPVSEPTPTFDVEAAKRDALALEQPESQVPSPAPVPPPSPELSVDAGPANAAPAGTPTTVSLTRGAEQGRGFDRNRELQRVYDDARRAGLDDAGARAATAVAVTEGGMGGAVGDKDRGRGSGGTFQQFFGPPGFEGQGNALAKEWGVSEEEALDVLRSDPHAANDRALRGYLGAAIKSGQARGLSGPALAEYAQRFGQRSESPERAAANYAQVADLRFEGAAGDAMGAGAPPERTGPRRIRAEDIPNQFTAEGELTPGEAAARCGPALAAWFASRNGRQPTLREATDLAARNGWTVQGGMNGLANESTLLDQMGVKHRVTQEVDEDALIRDVQSGNPVGISSGFHYFGADAYDPQTGKFHVGTSGDVVRGGSAWMSLGEIDRISRERSGTGLNGAIFVDDPSSPIPSPEVSGESVTTEGDRPPSEFEAPSRVAPARGVAPSGVTGVGPAPPFAAPPEPYTPPEALPTPSLRVPSQGEPPVNPWHRVGQAIGDAISGALGTAGGMVGPSGMASSIRTASRAPGLPNLGRQAGQAAGLGLGALSLGQRVLAGLEQPEVQLAARQRTGDVTGAGPGFLDQVTLALAEKIKSAYQRIRSEQPDLDPASALGQAIDEQQAGYVAVNKALVALDPTGGYASGAAIVGHRLATDPLTPAFGMGALGGLGGAEMMAGGMAAGGAYSAATGATPEQTAENVGTGADIGGIASMVPGAARLTERGVEAGAGLAGRAIEAGRRATENLPLGMSVRPTTEAAPTFYSQLRRVVEDKLGPRAGAAQVKATLLNNGVKPDELTWTGTDDFLTERARAGQPVTKQELLDHLDRNEVQVREVLHGPPPDAAPGQGATRYEQYTLPGGENYRELLITLPESPGAKTFERQAEAESDAARRQIVDVGLPPTATRYQLIQEFGPEEGARLDAARMGVTTAPPPERPSYTSHHWDEPNVLAHVRFNDRVDADGKKVLFVEEIQSDWHQAGRKKGYAPATPRDPMEQVPYGEVPAAPFQKTWPELAFKRVLRWAAENGYDRVAWTTGEQQAQRYNLANHVDTLTFDPDRRVLVGGRNGREVLRRQVDADQLPEYIGGDATRQLLAQPRESFGGEPGRPHVWFLDQEQQVGGEGMKGFYDKILPEVANKLGKRFGARVGTTNLPDPAAGITSGQAIALRTVAQTAINNNEPEVARILRALSEQGRPVEDVLPEWRRQGRFSDEDLDRAAGLAQQSRAWYGVVDQTTIPVHAIDVTPEMRASVVGQGQPLFVPRELGGAALGAGVGGLSEPPQQPGESDEDYARRVAGAMARGGAVGASVGSATRLVGRRRGPPAAEAVPAETVAGEVRSSGPVVAPALDVAARPTRPTERVPRIRTAEQGGRLESLGRRAAAMQGTEEQQTALRLEQEGYFGNIKADPLAQRSVRILVADAMDDLQGAAGQRRGVLSDDEVARRAADVFLDTPVDKWLKSRPGRAFNAEEATALGYALSYHSRLYDTMTKRFLDTPLNQRTQEMEELLAEKGLEVALLAGVRSGAAAEAGRALRAFQQLLLPPMGGAGFNRASFGPQSLAPGARTMPPGPAVGAFTNLPTGRTRAAVQAGAPAPGTTGGVLTPELRGKLVKEALSRMGAGKPFDEWVKRFSAIDTNVRTGKWTESQGVRARYNALRELVKPTVWEKIDAWRYASMLSSWKTHEVNFVGNLVEAAGRPTELLLAGQGKAAAKDVWAMGQAVPDAFRLAVESFTSGATLRSSQTTKLEQVRPRAFAEGILGTNTGVDKLAGTVVSIPLNALAASDEFFRAINHAGALHSEAWKMAKGDATKYGQLLANPTEELVTRVGELAAKAVYAEDPGALVNAISRARYGSPAGRIAVGFVLPFVRTPANIYRRGIGMTIRAVDPTFGVLESAGQAFAAGYKEGGGLKGGLRGSATADQVRLNVAKSLLAKLAVGSFAYLASQGLLSGNGPTDKSARAALTESGWQPHSIKIGDRWIDYTNMTPAAVPLGLVANAWEAYQEGQRPSREMASDVTQRMLKTLVDTSYLQGVSSLITGATTGGAAGAIQNWATGVVGSFVPASAGLAAVERVADPEQRVRDTVLQGVAGRIPGVSSTLETQPGVFGQPRTAGRETDLQGVIAQVLLPWRSSRENRDDPVAMEVARLSAGKGTVDWRALAANERGAVDVVPPRPTGVRTFGPLYAGERQDQPTRRTIQKEMGRAAHTALATTIANPQYQALSDEKKAATLQDAVQVAYQLEDRALGERVKRDPHHQALLALQSIPRYEGVKGSVEQIREQNFRIAQAKATLAQYQQQYGRLDGGDRLWKENRAAYRLADTKSIPSMDWKVLRDRVNKRYNGALDQLEKRGLLGVGAEGLASIDLGAPE